jgi:formylmethanofuran dehydrogenase subunit E
MLNNQNACRYIGITPDFSLKELAAFHGHLGPYIVIGYRIGRYIRTELCDDPFSLHAVVTCAGTPPESCLLDGIALGSGCTMGKGNLAMLIGKPLSATFTANGRQITVRPLPFTTSTSGPDSERQIEALAEEMYTKPWEELFAVE